MRLLSTALTSLAACLLFVSCGKGVAEAKKPANTPVTEAYTLLDKGQTAQALELLEGILEKDPSNSEARLLLASSYMGVAGIDVFSLHDAFNDVLFSKSLSQVFFSGSKPSGTGDPLTGSNLPDARHGRDDTPVEKLFESVDEFLNNVRRVTVIFERFPHVPEHKWPLMEQSLMNLDQLPPDKGVRVYRMFIRLIYLKEVLVTRVIRDPSFGTREWACSLELEGLDQSLRWISDTLAQVSDDFVHVYPGKASPFVRVQALFKEFEGALTSLESTAPSGSETADLAGQRRLREMLQCGSGTR